MEISVMVKKIVIPKFRNEVRKVKPDAKIFRLAYHRQDKIVECDVSNDAGEKSPANLNFTPKEVEQIIKAFIPKGFHFLVGCVTIDFDTEEIELVTIKKDGTEEFFSI